LKLLYSNIPSPSETVKNYYEKIDVASKRMSVLIDELLKFSRLGRKELNFISVDLNSLMNEIIEQAKPDIAQRKIDWNIQPLPIVPADKNLLKIAFENLISNAIKYTAKKEEAKIEIGSYEESADQIVIFIKDNGVGFDMAYSDKLFGVFQRLHSSDEFDGMGIGLANAKQIIFKHKGSIRAEGILNQGAIFYITLPK
jgi:light-regulated signal transduction histidine kinase (bacteriophytochrome)